MVEQYRLSMFLVGCDVFDGSRLELIFRYVRGGRIIEREERDVSGRRRPDNSGLQC
jgi:hypothetical protein